MKPLDTFIRYYLMKNCIFGILVLFLLASCGDSTNYSYEERCSKCQSLEGQLYLAKKEINSLTKENDKLYQENNKLKFENIQNKKQGERLAQLQIFNKKQEEKLAQLQSLNKKQEEKLAQLQSLNDTLTAEHENCNFFKYMFFGSLAVCLILVITFVYLAGRFRVSEQVYPEGGEVPCGCAENEE